MRSQNFAILFILMLSAIKGLACSCAGTFSFCETAAFNNIIVEVEVIKINGRNYDLKITDKILTSNLLQEDTLTLTERGTSCDIGLEGLFEVGDKLVVTFDHIYDDMDLNHASISFWQCGTYYLKLNFGFLEGDITRYRDETDQKMLYSKFKRNVENTCNANAIGEDDITVEANLTAAFLTINNLLESAIDYKVFDSSGRLVILGKLAESAVIEMNVEEYTPGVYFIVFNDENNRLVKKFVKI